ncbi:DUF92 domain-containing protein [Lysinibacillus sphaericus]
MNENIFVYLIILLVSIGGYKTRNLSPSGALSAFFMGLIITHFYHWRGLLLIGAFFLSSSLWSKLFSSSKTEIEGRLAKTSVRDWQQVAANGGPSVLFILLFHFTGNDWWLYSFAAAVAAANSDTWASEIGPLSKKSPLSIRSFRRVEKGTSGAVSPIGTIASIAGALFISLLFFVFMGSFNWPLFIMITAAGFLGNVLDTVAGAFWQAEFSCVVCHSTTESAVHCGAATVQSKGYAWLNNEAVNFMSSLFAGVMLFCMLVIING